MGYEVTFSFYNVNDQGEPLKEDLQVKTIKVGKELDSVPAEHVAATILKQFAKRDIWIDQVEVHEYVKRPIAYKEAKNGGVILAGKRYNLGLNEIMKWAVDENSNKQESHNHQEVPQQAQPQPQMHQQPQMQPQQQQYVTLPQHQAPGEHVNGHQVRKLWPHEQQQRPQQYNEQQMMNPDSVAAYPDQQIAQPVTYQQKRSAAGLLYAHRDEVCDPPPELVHEVRSLWLTPGKKYRVLEERLARDGKNMLYRVINDQGREAFIAWHYFRQPQMVRHEVPFYDQNGVLRSQEMYVDEVARQRNAEPQPRLLYDNAPAYSGGGGSGDPRLGSIMQRMDAAIQRRRR